MKTKACDFLYDRDFNVRVSVLEGFVNPEEKETAYIELIRDSLGVQIINSPRTFMGNYVAIKSDGEVFSQSFQTKGIKLIESLPIEVKESSAVRFNIRLKEGGYKSWIVSRQPDVCCHLNAGDFNVRVSVLARGQNSILEAVSEYCELVRDSLGEDVVNNSNVLIGNYVVYRGDGETKTYPFQLKGTAFISNVKPQLRRCTSIRVNIRLKQGGFKSWVIFN